jgi:DnaJ-class molecular chaperone
MSLNICKECNGFGLIKQWVATIEGIEKEVIPCPACGGTGEHEDVCK